MDVTNYSSSSSASSVRPPYEVFFSFRGVDTNRQFVGRLLTCLADSRLSVFIDEKDEEADKGIDPAMVEVIGQSKISIPIISPEYASSKRCLMVLAKMLDRKDTTNLAIIPIFDHVNPSNIGSFMERKNQGSDGMLLEPWKTALHRIGQLKSYSLDHGSDRLVSLIVLSVKQQLKKAELAGTSMPIGIDNLFVKIMTRLEVDYRNGQPVIIRGNEVRMVVIHGIPGVGKTTLAKFVYNQLYHLFEGCSFLRNIREISKTESLEHLQSQLVSDLLKQEPISLGSLEEGIYYIKHRFRSMRVLIVLDGVDERHHLEAFARKLNWFGSRSRIIVTTRKAGLLNIPEGTATYEVEPMDSDQGLCLFCRHAFGGSSPHEGYDNLSRKFVSAIGGRPLEIEVLGSFLYRKKKEIWHETLHQQMKNPENFVHLVLMATCQALDQGAKDIFLDIACFFEGKDKRIPFYMWEDCGFNPCTGLESLLLTSLVKIGENKELLVYYDLLRDLGRKIVYREDQDPGRRSRLWNHEEALNTLRSRKGTKWVQALYLKFDDGSHNYVTREEFESLSDLRFLKLDNAYIRGNFMDLLSNLRWLDWRGCPATFEAENLDLENLVVLDLSWSKVNEDWKGWSQIKMERLKVLNLTGCDEMLITPNFEGYQLLEMLILECCSQLVKIDPSIRCLKFLVSLNLKSCSNLSMLPQGIGGMESLKELLMDGTSIREIPESIACMKKLETLSALNCYSLIKLPKSICLEALSMLLLDNAKILNIPDTIGSLVKLKQLSLRDCQEIEKLPDSIGKLGCSLVELDISGTLILELPDSMKNLRLLRVLKMERCRVRKFSSAIGGLRKIEEIHASLCRSLEGRIHNNIRNLQFLKILTLGYSCVSSLPASIQSLSHLQTLDLLACNNLETFPMLPSSLTCLRISSKKMNIIPDIHNLFELEELSFGDENPKELIVPPLAFFPASILTKPQSLSLESFTKLKSLGLSHSQILNLGLASGSAGDSQLEKVIVTGANLQEVLGLPSSLSVLWIHACLSLRSLPTVQNLNNLLELKLLKSAVKEIEGLGGLTSLEILVVSCCPIVHLEGLSELTSLKRLSLKNCNSLKKLPNLSNLTMLKVLEIHQCQRICDVEGLEELPSLEELHVSKSEAERSPQVKNAQERIRGNMAREELHVSKSEAERSPQVKNARERFTGNMAKQVLINLMTTDHNLRAKACTIASSEANGLKSVNILGERRDLLEVIAEEIDPTEIIDKIRKVGMPDAKLLGCVWPTGSKSG